MKNLNIIPLIIGVLILAAQVVFANDKYTEVMKKNIEAVYEAKSVEDFQSLANTFHRIAEAEKTKWEAFYYEAYAYVMMVTVEKDASKKDAMLDASLKALESAKTLQPAESELVALEGFVHMMRVTVDPASRGQQYSGMAFQSFNKAVSMNPENPRALALMAQMEFGTAQFFGSSTASACATITKAVDKFENQKPASVLSPVWGKGMAQGLKNKCQ
jgi:hypothetical protein